MVPISAVLQRDSLIHAYIYILLSSFPLGSSQDTDHSSLYYKPCYLLIQSIRHSLHSGGFLSVSFSEMQQACLWPRNFQPQWNPHGILFSRKASSCRVGCSPGNLDSSTLPGLIIDNKPWDLKLDYYIYGHIHLAWKEKKC